MRPNPQSQSISDGQGTPWRGNPSGLKFLVDMSNSVLVFMRKDVGHRLLDPMAFGRHFLVLVVLGLIVMRWPHVYEHAPYGGIALICFALLMQARCNQLRKESLRANLDPNNPQHSMSRGVSPSAARWARLRISELNVQRVVEPLSAIALGAWLIGIHFVILGAWFVVAGISLLIVESVVDHETNTEIFDAQDAHAKGKMLQNSVPTMAAKKNASLQDPVARSSSVATTSPELDRLRKGASNRRK
jgi:hypothetical protein